jgi:CheY-like chemotaxis protein
MQMHTILVVDDNADSCKALAKLLTMMGDKALCVCSGQLALNSLQLHIPCLVILDVMMPGMDGMEVLSRIRSEPKTAHLPVVMFSAIDDPEYPKYAKSKGATDFWMKGKLEFAALHQLVAPYMVLPAAA